MEYANKDIPILRLYSNHLPYLNISLLAKRKRTELLERIRLSQME